MRRFNEEAYREIEREAMEVDVAVLSTGDPMVAGLGRFFKSASIIPGISSVQVALGRMGADLCDVTVFNAHSMEPDYSRGKNILILAKKGVRLNFPGRRLKVLENLENNEEKIYEAEDFFEVKSDYTIVFVEVKG